MSKTVIVSGIDENGKVSRSVETTFTYMDGWIDAFLAQYSKVEIKKS